MTKKYIYMILSTIFISLIIVSSYVIGYLNAVTTYRVDFKAKDIDKYVELTKDAKFVLYDTDKQITLPKGTVLYYKDRNVVADSGNLFINIVGDDSDLSDITKPIPQPGFYSLDSISDSDNADSSNNKIKRDAQNTRAPY